MKFHNYSTYYANELKIDAFVNDHDAVIGKNGMNKNGIMHILFALSCKLCEGF